jgi:hypothetical protein
MIDQTIDEREIASIHESAHAVVAHIFNRPTRRLLIRPNGSGLATTQALDPRARRKFSPDEWDGLVLEEVMVCMAGPVAERLYSGKADRAPAAVDCAGADDWLGMVGIVDDELFEDALLSDVEETLMENWPAVEAIAERLLRDGSMTGDDVAEICRRLHVAHVPDHGKW